MSVTYPGLPVVARRFWRAYLLWSVSMLAVTAITGAIGGVLVLWFLPNATGYLVLAGVFFGLHMGALAIRDIRAEEYDASQATFSSAKELIAIVIVLGAWVSTLLLIGTIVAYILEARFGAPIIVTVLVAAYYPVLELLLTRRGWRTPGVIAINGTIIGINTIVDIHQSVVDTMPVIWKRRRPQS